MDKKKKASDFGRRLFNLFGTASVQFNRRNGKLGLELSNATSSICWIFAPLFDEAHNPKVVGSNPTPATNHLRFHFQGLAQPEQALYLFVN